MATKIKKYQASYAPTDVLYPEEDGKPMAASDLHREQLFRTLSALETHFSQDPTVYVSGDILMYYVQGVPSKSISPDVLVSFEIGMKKRRTYLVWEEGKVPDFVMEFSSKNTYQNDLTKKMDIYASLKIQDYFLYDAEGLYLPSQLIGFELVNGVYEEVQPDESGGVRSSSLGLDFRIREGEIGIYDPVAGDWVRTRAEIAEARAAQEASARQKAEAEVAQLREEIARLQARS
ncbi:MAG: Uma2 family endonuclease [Candidatus Poribacteria bacterium]|nr:Uma2 family endonuclease [Candidatus Poribacteria bacterium]MDE0485045.1 Uma2 family endonuclease [Candidatus Poribacteria bacterium]